MSVLGGVGRGGVGRWGRWVSGVPSGVSGLAGAGGFRREPFQEQRGRKPQWASAEEAWEGLGRVRSGARLFVQGFAATPGPLLDSFYNYAQRRALRDVELIHLILEGSPLWATQGDGQDMMNIHEPHAMRSNNLFVGRNMRASVAAGTADYVPIFLSDIPRLLARTQLDLAVVHVSQPDEKGFCSLGTSVDVTSAAVRSAKRIVALANPHMPRTLGDGILHSSNIDVMVYGDVPLVERARRAADPELSKRIGGFVAELVEDGATLQIGTGALPSAAAAELRGHRELGIHAETFGDEVMALVESGAVTNQHKRVHPGKLVASWISGSQALYEWADDNPLIYMGAIEWVNEPSVIAKNPKVTAINSALEVDLSGQVAADSVGHRVISGFGGQLDFMRGAARSEDGRGKPIIVLASQTPDGQSKIVAELRAGAGVVSTRAHVDWVVTEHGAVSLFGKNLRQRAAALISVAHPDHRHALEQQAFANLNQMPSLH